MEIEKGKDATAPAHLLTVTEACDVLGISRPTLYALMNRGELKTLKIGKLRRVPSAEIDRLISVAS
jgi:excisionase family DNA binding protein